MFEIFCLYDFGGQGSSHAELFYKKDFLKIFAKFTVKHLCWSLFYQKQPLEVFCKKRCNSKIVKCLSQSLFFNKVAGLRPANFIKIDSGTGVFL